MYRGGRKSSLAPVLPLAQIGPPCGQRFELSVSTESERTGVARSLLALALSCLLHLLLFLFLPAGQFASWGERGQSTGEKAISLFLLPLDSASLLEAEITQVRSAAGGSVRVGGLKSPAPARVPAGAAAPGPVADAPLAAPEEPIIAQQVAARTAEGPSTAEEVPLAGEALRPAEDTPQAREGPPSVAAVEGSAGSGTEVAPTGVNVSNPAGPAPGGLPGGLGALPWHPVPRTAPLPDYPPQARREGKEGTARLQVEVLPSGNVGRVELLASSGHPALDQAALEAVRRWSFTPAPSEQKEGAGGTDQPAAPPAPIWLVIAVRFALLNP